MITLRQVERVVIFVLFFSDGMVRSLYIHSVCLARGGHRCVCIHSVFKVTNFFPLSVSLHFSVITHKVATVRKRESFIVIESM